MLDRLKKLILESDILCHTCGENTDSYCAEYLAEYLIENGVIVPPCKEKEGAWRVVSENTHAKTVECTDCKEQFWFMKKGQLNIDRMPYCPKCGLKKKGGESDDR